jgi:predicted  nucleic acid-binding Zn-ribbon protein
MLNEKVKYFEDNFNNCEQIKAQYDSLVQDKEHLRCKLYEKEKLTTELQNEFNEISKGFQNLNTKFLSQEDASSKVNQLVELVRQYSKELNEATHKNKLYENELMKINREYSELCKKVQKMEIENKHNENELTSNIDGINKNINLLCQWIENYLGVYFNEKIEIPDIPQFYNKTLNFETLREIIFKTRFKIYQQQNIYEQQIQKLHNEQFDLIDKIDKLNKQIVHIKTENSKLREFNSTTTGSITMFK